MPFSLVHAVCPLTLLSEALLTHMGAPLSVLIVLLQFSYLLTFYKASSKKFLNLGVQVEGLFMGQI